MAYKGSHTRDEPNGYNGPVSVLGEVSVHDFRYKDKVRLRVGGGRVVDAVVDLMVSRFWGGPRIALAAKDNAVRLGLLVREGALTRKLVYQNRDGGWSEIRDGVGEPTMQEVQQWLEEFEGDKPPTPMP